MPRASAIMLRISLLCLLTGAVLGTLSAAGLARHLSARLHMDLMLFGFMIQFALATGAWILPKKGGVLPVWKEAIVYNTGLSVILLAHLSASAPWVEAAGRIVLIAGAAGIVRALWPRVRQILPAAHV